MSASPTQPGQATPTRRPMPIQDLLVLWGAILLFVLMGVVWVTGQLAALLSHHTTAKVSLHETLAVLVALPTHLGDPAEAWPAAARAVLPGPVGFYAVLAVVLAAVVGVGYCCWRFYLAQTAWMRRPASAAGDQTVAGSSPAAQLRRQRRRAQRSSSVTAFQIEGEHVRADADEDEEDDGDAAEVDPPGPASHAGAASGDQDDGDVVTPEALGWQPRQQRRAGWLLSLGGLLLVLVLVVVAVAAALVVTDRSKPQGTTAARQPARVVRVAAGDLVVVEPSDAGLLATGQPVTVRLLGIKAPQRCFGRQAARHVRALLPPRQPVELEADRSLVNEVGEVLRYVYVGERLLNAQLVGEGYAVAAPDGHNSRYRARLATAQVTARAARRGRWGPPCNGQ
jgi:endonuclease YncB( thermonuclease family)